MANALLFDFHNGSHDSAYLVATMIASCSVSPRRALALSAVVEFTGPFLERMASLLTDAAAEISNGVLRLQDNPSVANEHTMRAKALENRVERVYREAIADLFSGPRDVDHLVEMLRLREITAIFPTWPTGVTKPRTL